MRRGRDERPAATIPLGETTPPGGGADRDDHDRARRVPVRGRERDRYRDLGVIARGGMAEVRRVWDVKLRRGLAMKILDWDLAEDAAARARFVAEANATAGLQHPGIVPVHDWGELEDGRPWFTMKEVRGRTLAALIAEAHGGASGGDGRTFVRLVDIFRRAAEAVAYAHREGVLHLDLKPSNIMVGELAEVLVLDWGLATPMAAGSAPVAAVAGTPAYMAPEQASGEALGPWTDVHALGAVLGTILTGAPPFDGTPTEILDKVARRTRPGFTSAAARRADVPERLLAIVTRAMAAEPRARHADAGDLAADVGAWLDGTRRREGALRVVAEADALLPERDALLEEARRLRAAAEARRRELPPHASARDKAEVWRLEDDAVELERRAQVVDVRWFQLLGSALHIDETLAEAHQRLARHHHARLVAAEREGRADEAARSEAFLRAHDRGELAAFLAGDGALSVDSSPRGARVSAFRWIERERRLVLGRGLELGVTPVADARVPHGSHLLVVRAPGFVPTCYPVIVERAGRWDAPAPIRLWRRDEIPRGFVFVPAGWTWIGGDPEAGEALPRRRVWIDDFFIARFQVTNADYLAFLNALVEEGRDEEALRAAPRSPLGVETGEPQLQVERDERGRFRLRRDHVGREWQPDWPVCLVDWPSACAYARWKGAQVGRPLRLPNELEWEKAGRGVDGRFWPWGNHTDATRANILGSGSAPGVGSIRAFPLDRSPYGVRGLAGNVREWCINVWKFDGPAMEGERVTIDAAAPEDPEWRAARGGSWHTVPSLARLAGRFVAEPYRRFTSLGFRLAFSPG